MYYEKIKDFSPALLILLFFTSFLGVTSVSASEVDPSVSASEATYGFAPSALDPDSTYPGTNIRVRVGDVLYSSKALGGSAMLAGHVGIIGPDYMVYHVNAVNDNQGEGGKRDTISITKRGIRLVNQSLSIERLMAVTQLIGHKTITLR
ncbi:MULTISPECIES: hypothetical protein [Paenibacillus]|uniref:Uncharacterized protein n=1 Tax=Paenibacillus peoriae TaxID=59893 RepID=A0ABU1QM13_9BACL|nr:MULTISPECIES: hypothetical protein [Paenibacillus]MCP3747118.1 hypothetical protein [Paenibacillus sp. A3M_27_13]MDR6780674.1 hypothetical protein [Paenibacillus peoriae]